MLSNSQKLRNYLTFVSRFGIGMSIANFQDAGTKFVFILVSHKFLNIDLDHRHSLNQVKCKVARLPSISKSCKPQIDHRKVPCLTL